MDSGSAHGRETFPVVGCWTLGLRKFSVFATSCVSLDDQLVHYTASHGLPTQQLLSCCYNDYAVCFIVNSISLA